MRPRILLADDHPMVVLGIQKILQPEFDVVGTAEDGQKLIEQAQQFRPDAIVMDISMPGLNGLQAARQLKKLLPSCKLIFLTMHGDANYVQQAFDAGASGYLLKRSAVVELSHALHATLKGCHYLTPLISATNSGEIPTYSTSSLTPRVLTSRQQEILQLIAEGHSTKDMASILQISVKTVEFHKSKVMERLDLHTTSELVKYALTQGFIEQDPPCPPSC